MTNIGGVETLIIQHRLGMLPVPGEVLLCAAFELMTR
jgi:hypothetical protein